ncbi:VCBS repeat-containing protein [Spongiivirga sp. MCCC 1A20706]|uniref:VCBS repeat-containing protein n=1 Tax=Spongiivirga sp. MCCC 1A20706 TaxID=3160963 RepID=UPI0039779832
MSLFRFALLLVAVVIFISCNSSNEKLLFQQLDDVQTGIDFENAIEENDEINVIDFQYCYNGGGVGIGDFNNDNLPDIYFTGNQVSSKLYLNLGNFKFKEVTEIAQVNTTSWVTGVSVVDINADGLDDIYLNVGGANCKADCFNLLFVNQGNNKDGIPIFKEKASEYGLNEAEYAQQTVFFDYDLDGDLDAFIARNGNVRFDKNSPMPKRYYPYYLNDVLLKNTFNEKLGHPYFKDVSKENGITGKGFALGLGINDFNEDGLPDVFVGNDFITSDLLYINTNETEKRFSDQTKQFFAHSTYNSMGLDIADINNDALPDLMVVDMLPNGYKRQKMMLGAMNYDKFQLSLKNDYQPQYMRNTLSINSGKIANESLKFQELSFYANTAMTDWSWAPLLVDFDLDGLKDIFITNGYGKDVTDLDFINYTKQNNVFGTPQAREQKLKALLKDLPEVKMTNFFFENKGELFFEDVSTSWSNQQKSLSNGAAYADFDLDGDLDLVINNINQKATILKNNTTDNEDINFLTIQLKGTKQNKNAIGAKITLWSEGEVQQHYQSVIRGYLSSVQPGAYFGLKSSKIDSLEIKWPLGEVYKLKNIKANQEIVVDITSAKNESPTHSRTKLIVKKVVGMIPFEHTENVSNDFNYQQLLMKEYSKNGPCIASANSNGENLLFVGGSKGQPGLVMKLENDIFNIIQELESEYEDTDARFLDVNQDGFMDLYVSSGGNEFESNSTFYQDRLYVNNGQNNFSRSSTVLPNFLVNTSCVLENDFDKDGDLDLFVGGGFQARSYPIPSSSYLLVNEQGKYEHSTNLDLTGIINDAVWSDIDGNGWDDLFAVGEWMPLTIFKNENGKLVSIQPTFLDKENQSLKTSGWWKQIIKGDFDNDGDIDFVVGNQGLNNIVNPSQEQPIHIYTGDYDKNGSVDPVIGAYFDNGGSNKELMVLHTRDDVMKQLSALKNRFTKYEDFSKIKYKELLNIKNLKEETLKTEMFESVYLENIGNFKFKIKPLPKNCQLAPINTMLVHDVDQDGNLDVFLAGNNYYTETHFGGNDALNGLFLKGDNNGSFKVLDAAKSGFYVPGQSNDIEKIKLNSGGELILVAQNNDSIATFKNNQH